MGEQDMRRHNRYEEMDKDRVRRDTMNMGR